mgnify:CR=1 FL=1
MLFRSAAHPNSRFTARADQCPILDEDWEDPAGVPISAIIFGGRRSDTVPLVYQSLDWNHGTYLGSVMQSEKTAAADDGSAAADIRSDPFAMLPFCGYAMGDYFQHWLNVGASEKTTPEALPKIFYVNWFRKDEDGDFMWPGFGDNSRVLEWIFRRTEADDEVATVETPIGYVPDVDAGGLDLSGLDLPSETVKELVKVDVEVWKKELDHYASEHQRFEDEGKLPQGIKDQHARIMARLTEA